jgi:hypothetical protein
MFDMFFYTCFILNNYNKIFNNAYIFRKSNLNEETNKEKELSEILKDASQLHEDLRNYGNLKDIDKPLIVSGILLALREAEFKNFSIVLKQCLMLDRLRQNKT